MLNLISVLGKIKRFEQTALIPSWESKKEEKNRHYHE